MQCLSFAKNQFLKKTTIDYTTGGAVCGFCQLEASNPSQVIMLGLECITTA